MLEDQRQNIRIEPCHFSDPVSDHEAWLTSSLGMRRGEEVHQGKRPSDFQMLDKLCTEHSLAVPSGTTNPEGSGGFIFMLLWSPLKVGWVRKYPLARSFETCRDLLVIIGADFVPAVEFGNIKPVIGYSL
jgi:hypothetical protein